MTNKRFEKFIPVDVREIVGTESSEVFQLPFAVDGNPKQVTIKTSGGVNAVVIGAQFDEGAALALEELYEPNLLPRSDYKEIKTLSKRKVDIHCGEGENYIYIEPNTPNKIHIQAESKDAITVLQLTEKPHGEFFIENIGEMVRIKNIMTIDGRKETFCDITFKRGTVNIIYFSRIRSGLLWNGMEFHSVNGKQILQDYIYNDNISDYQIHNFQSFNETLLPYAKLRARSENTKFVDLAIQNGKRQKRLSFTTSIFDYVIHVNPAKLLPKPSNLIKKNGQSTFVVDLKTGGTGLGFNRIAFQLKGLSSHKLTDEGLFLNYENKPYVVWIKFPVQDIKMIEGVDSFGLTKKVYLYTLNESFVESDPMDVFIGDHLHPSQWESGGDYFYTFDGYKFYDPTIVNAMEVLPRQQQIYKYDKGRKSFLSAIDREGYKKKYLDESNESLTNPSVYLVEDNWDVFLTAPESAKQLFEKENLISIASDIAKENKNTLIAYSSEKGEINLIGKEQKSTNGHLLLVEDDPDISFDISIANSGYIFSSYPGDYESNRIKQVEVRFDPEEFKFISTIPYHKTSKASGFYPKTAINELSRANHYQWNGAKYIRINDINTITEAVKQPSLKDYGFFVNPSLPAEKDEFGQKCFIFEAKTIYQLVSFENVGQKYPAVLMTSLTQSELENHKYRFEIICNHPQKPALYVNEPKYIGLIKGRRYIRKLSSISLKADQLMKKTRLYQDHYPTGMTKGELKISVRKVNDITPYIPIGSIKFKVAQ